jgi:hypothetical protein
MVITMLSDYSVVQTRSIFVTIFHSDYKTQIVFFQAQKLQKNGTLIITYYIVNVTWIESTTQSYHNLLFEPEKRPDSKRQARAVNGVQ